MTDGGVICLNEPAGLSEKENANVENRENCSCNVAYGRRL